MSAPDLAHLRLLNQRLTGPRCDTPAEVAHRLGALQAQDYGQATWAVGTRTRQPTLLAVEQAIATRKLVLTWPLRGTLHFIPAEDAHWILRLLTPRRLKAAETRLRQLELDHHILARARTIFHDALRGGQQLSRPAMMQLLEQAGISPQGQRGYHVLWHLAQEGLICFGPQQGKQQTFVLLDEWVPHPRLLPPDAALTELARRYFTSHGPATVHDFAWWAGLPVTLARQGLEAVQSSFATLHHADKTYWLPEPALPATPLLPTVQLLPGFDEYLLGYQDRRAVLDPAHAAHIVPGGNGVFRPMVVVNGQITGTWQRILRTSHVDINIRFFTPDQPPEELLQEAARQYSEFLSISLGKMTIE